MKKKLWYFTDQLGGTSQTFVDDLVAGFSKQDNTDLTVICNSLSEGFDPQKHGKYSVIVNRFLILSDFKFKALNIISKFFHRDTKKYLYESSHLKLSRTLNHIHADVAYIDFGNVAAFVYAYLNSRNIPYVVHFHGADITKGLQDNLYRVKLSGLLSTAKALIVPSHHMRRMLILEGANDDSIHVIKYGVRTQYRPMKFENRIPASLVFLGRLTPKKNPMALIEAFNLVKKKFNNATLTIIGDGSEMERVKARINKFNLNGSVTLYGALKNENALEIVRQHQLYVQHSVTSYEGDQEGFPISLAEAASLEMPIVSTLHNGIPENVIDGVTGFIVQEYNYEAMAEKILMLLNDEKLAKEMGERGRAHILSLCRIEHRVEKIEKILGLT